MVSTRSHPSQFPPPDLATPSKSPSKSSPSSTSTVARRSKSTALWSHTPSNLTLFWLLLSVPIVIWDTGYMLGRPHTLPGGALHWPVWSPYALYGTIDYIYGFTGWSNSDGFGAAQSLMNIVETAGYIWYLSLVYTQGTPSRLPGKGAPRGMLGALGEARVLSGRSASVAVLVGFTAMVMTLAKTVLYFLNDACSGWSHTGHNTWATWILLWVIPNGPWIVIPAYLATVLGSDLLAGLDAAATGVPKKTL